MGQNRRAIRQKWWTEFTIAYQVEEIEMTEKTKQKEVAKQEEVAEYEQ